MREREAIVKFKLMEREATIKHPQSQGKRSHNETLAKPFPDKVIISEKKALAACNSETISEGKNKVLRTAIACLAVPKSKIPS